MTPFSLTPSVREDLRAIADYDDPPAARRLIAAIERSMHMLGEVPNAGRRRTDLSTNEEVRSLPVEKFLIVYRTDRQPIQIIRVVRQSRDIGRLIR